MGLFFENQMLKFVPAINMARLPAQLKSVAILHMHFKTLNFSRYSFFC